MNAVISLENFKNIHITFLKYCLILCQKKLPIKDNFYLASSKLLEFQYLFLEKLHMSINNTRAVAEDLKVFQDLLRLWQTIKSEMSPKYDDLLQNLL